MNATLELARVSLQGDRAINQDRCLTLQAGDDTLLALADGLGGHPRGEVAAQLFIDTCEHLFRTAHHPLADPQALLAGCLERAHAAIVRFGAAQHPPIAPRTTGIACLVQHGHAWWSHVGDSRLYLFRDGKLIGRTQDHSRRRERRGQTRLTITRCLGGLKLPPDLAESGPVQLHANDVLLLSSDGFWSGFTPEVLGKHLYRPGNLGDNLQPLAEAACRNAHPRSDNTSAVALRWQPPAANVVGKASVQPRATPTV